MCTSAWTCIRKRSQIAVVDAAGDEQRNRNVPNDPVKLVPILGVVPPGTPVALEAAYGWGWLVELLEELELEPHLVHPSRCKAIASARLKNDKVDARTLAQLLRADLLPEAWIAPPEIRDLRALLRHRASLVRLATGLKNRVHAVLADRGISPPSSLWATPGRAWLAALELPPTPRAIIEDCCRGAGHPGQADRPPGGGDRRAGQARPTGPGPHGLARRRQADGHDPARRDR